MYCIVYSQASETKGLNSSSQTLETPWPGSVRFAMSSQKCGHLKMVKLILEDIDNNMREKAFLV